PSAAEEDQCGLHGRRLDGPGCTDQRLPRILPFSRRAAVRGLPRRRWGRPAPAAVADDVADAATARRRRAPMKNAAAALIAVAMLFGLLQLFQRWELSENALEVGTPITAFRLPDAQGKPYALPVRGQAVVINYWA